MADNDKKVTFELKDLSYDELINSYLEVTDFLTFLDDAKVAVKGNNSDEESEDGEETQTETQDEESEETEES